MHASHRHPANHEIGRPVPAQVQRRVVSMFRADRCRSSRTAVHQRLGLTQSLLGEASPGSTRCPAGRQGNHHPVIPAVTCTAQSLTSRHAAVRTRHRRQRLVSSRTGRSAVLETVEPPVRGRKVWRRCANWPPVSPAQNSLGHNMYSSADGAITPAPFTLPTAARCSTSTPNRFPCAMKSKASSASFHSRRSGAGSRETVAQGRPDAASRWIAQAARWMENRYSRH